MESQKAFQEWLEETMQPLTINRKEFADRIRAKIEDLQWAFESGYHRAKSEDLETK